MAWSNVVFRWSAHARYQDTPPTLADGELGELQADVNGCLKVAVVSTVEPAAATAVRTIPASGLATASGTIATAAAELIEVQGHSETNTACYLMFFDTVGTPVNGAVPKQKLRIPADCPMFSSTLSLKPAAYANGIRWAASATANTLTTVAVNLYVEAVYR
jgi:hypothetical protein